MAKFAVGMRVRLVKFQAPSGGLPPIPVGDCGVIIDFTTAESGDMTVRGDVLRMDCNCRVQFEFGGFRASHTDNIEPILPEGAAPSIYSYQELMDKLREGERV